MQTALPTHTPSTTFMCWRMLVLTLVLLFGTAVQARDLKPIEVAPHVYYFAGELGPATMSNEGFMSNAGFVVTDDQVVVIDALGTPALGQAMLDAIRRITTLPVRLVIITHYHADHYYGLQTFKDVGAEVWASHASRGITGTDESRARLEQRKRDLSMFMDDSFRFVTPDRYLESDERVTRGNVNFDIQLIEGGAHAVDDLMVLVNTKQPVLFAGDLFFSGRVPFVGSANTARWLSALQRMSSSKPDVVVPGHGPASSNPLPAIRFTHDYLVYLREQMAKGVEELLGFEETYSRTDWSAFKDIPAFSAANHLNASGVYLEMEAESLRH